MPIGKSLHVISHSAKCQLGSGILGPATTQMHKWLSQPTSFVLPFMFASEIPCHDCTLVQNDLDSVMKELGWKLKLNLEKCRIGSPLIPLTTNVGNNHHIWPCLVVHGSTHTPHVPTSDPLLYLMHCRRIEWRRSIMYTIILAFVGIGKRLWLPGLG